MKRDEQGITLILLVITIIVLLILAGVTLGSMNNTGIIDHSVSVVERTKIENQREEIEKAIIARMKTSIREITIENIIEILEKKGIIDEGNGNPETGLVKTKDGYIYEIKEKENGDWEVKYIGKGDLPERKINISVSISPKTLSEKVTITITAQDEGGIVKYVNPEGKTTSYGTGPVKKFSTTYDVTENGTYTFTLTNTKGETETEIVKIDNILKGTIGISTSNENVTKEDVIVTVVWPTSSSRAIKEISIDGGKTYTRYTGNTSKITISSNCTVIARIRDGETVVKTATITIINIDKNNPIVTAKQNTLTIEQGESHEISQYFTVNTNGIATATIKYIDTSDGNKSITNTNTLTEGTHIITCTATKTTGATASATMTVTVNKAQSDTTLVKYFTWATTDTEAKITGFSDLGKAQYEAGNVASLDIPETYNNLPVTEIGESAFKNCTKIYGINIPNSVTTLGTDAFYGCTGIKAVFIPKSIDKIVSNSTLYSPFRKCTNLGTIEFEEGITKIPKCMFDSAGLSKNTVITIPNSVTVIENYAFSECEGIKSVTIPEGVTKIGLCAFNECTGITSLDIPSTVTSLGRAAFGNCTGLTEIFIPKSVTEVTDSGWNYLGPFGNCTNINKVTFEEGTTKIPAYIMHYAGLKTGVEIVIPNTVTRIGTCAFSECNGITGITIPNSVTALDTSAFNTCENLAQIDIPSSVTDLGCAAFRSCTSLTEIFIPKTVQTVTDCGWNYVGPFGDCTNISKVTFEEGTTKIIEYILHYAGLKTGVEIIIPNTVTEIEKCAFSKSNGITGITIPNSVVSIGTSAFNECAGLKQIDIPTSVENLGCAAFRNCTGLTEIFIPKTVKKVTDCGWNSVGPFGDCTNISKVTFEEGTTEIIEYILHYAGLKTGVEIIIPNTVTEIKSCAFSQSAGITGITIPNSVVSIGTSAFNECEGLKQIDIPASVVNLGCAAFRNCTSLTEIVIPKTVQKVTDCNWNSVGPFGDCANISKVTFEEGTTTAIANILKYADLKENVEIIMPETVTTIGTYAFYECDGIKDIRIPKAVTVIESYAFSNCPNLATVRFGGSETEWNAVRKSSGNDAITNATISYEQ